MLGDRDYMRGAPGRGRAGEGGMECLLLLIAINVAIYLLSFLGGRSFAGMLVLSGNVLGPFEIWRFVTAAFTHVDFWHLFFNMFGLYMFGSLSAPLLGWKRFLALYLVSGVAGNLLWFGFNMNSAFWLLGASGAVVGVIMATAMMMPNIQVLLLFFPVPVKLKTMAIVYIILEVIQQQAMPSNIAYLAHIGGFIGGFLFMELWASELVAWHPLGAVFGRRNVSAPKPPEMREESSPSESRPPRGWTVSAYDAYTKDGTVTRAELDRILDKISRTGINSLSESEMETLRKAREQMKSGQSSR